MCLYIIKKYIYKLNEYIHSLLLSMHYDIPLEKIYYYLDYHNDVKYVNNLQLLNKDIDIIICEFIIGEFKILKINKIKHIIIKKYFKNNYLQNLFKSKNRKISLKFDYYNENVINFVMAINILFQDQLIIHVHNNRNQTNYYQISYDIAYIDYNLFNFTLQDLHYFIRIMNHLNRNDFNIFYEHILENSQDLQNDILLKCIQLSN